MNKDKRQKRFQQKKRHIKRQTNNWNTITSIYTTKKEQPDHRYHKMNAFNCSCHFCRSYSDLRKLEGPTMQERKFYAEEIE